ncbi:MAG: 2,4-dienoyl-CoA reductase [Bacteroidota bacterium]
MYNQPMLRDDALKGKVIIVTGGGSGLGRSMTRYFLQLGAKVVISSRSMERLEKAAEELQEETGGEVLPVACDVRNPEMVENMLARAVERFKQVDILVNNAAGNFVCPTEKLSYRAFDTVVEIVLKGSYNCTLAVGKYWIENQIKGNILNIVTTYAWTGSPFVVPSACGKAGVLAMTRSLAVEWGRRYGIRSNAIAPGPFPTPGAFERLFPKAMREALDIDPLGKVPLARVGEHQELANLAAYLVSDFASYVNGEVVTIDAGEWLDGAGEFSMMQKVPDEMWDIMIAQGKKIKT